MSLYIFGDSFGQEWDGGGYKVTTWTAHLSTELGVDCKNYALSGSSLEYTYKQFYAVGDTLKQDDLVILILTDLSRKWLIKNEPSRASLKMIEDSHKDDKNFVKLVQQYYSQLFNLEIEEINFKSFLYAFSKITDHLKIKPLIIVAFDRQEYDVFGHSDIEIQRIHPNVAVGSLWKISKQEFKQELLDNIMTNFREFRTNHLSQANHLILANKIIENIRNNMIVDLNNGFVKDLYTVYENDNQGYKDHT